MINILSVLVISRIKATIDEVPSKRKNQLKQSTLIKSFQKWECCGNDLDMTTAAVRLSSRPL